MAKSQVHHKCFILEGANMTITTTFNKDLMPLGEVKSMADTLDQLIEFQDDLLDRGKEPSAEAVEDFFWKFFNSTSHIEQGWRRS